MIELIDGIDGELWMLLFLIYIFPFSFLFGVVPFKYLSKSNIFSLLTPVLLEIRSLNCLLACLDFNFLLSDKYFCLFCSFLILLLLLLLGVVVLTPLVVVFIFGLIRLLFFLWILD